MSRVHHAEKISATVWRITCGVKTTGKEWTPLRNQITCPKCKAALEKAKGDYVTRRGMLG